MSDDPVVLPQEFDGWISPAVAAEMLKCSSTWVRMLCDRGELVCRRTPVGRLVSYDSVLRVCEDGWVSRRGGRRDGGEK